MIQAGIPALAGARQPDTVGALGKMVSLAAMMREFREHDENKKRSLAEAGKDNAIKDVVKKTSDPKTGKPNYSAAAKEIQAIDPERAIAWWNAASDEQKAQVAKLKEDATFISQQSGALLALDDAQLPPGYTSARAAMIQGGRATEEQVPDASTFGDVAGLRSFLTMKRNEALTVQQQLDAAEKAVDQGIAKDREKREADKAKETKHSDPMTRMVDGKRQDVTFGSDGKWYLAGDRSKALTASQVSPLPERPRGEGKDPEDEQYKRDFDEYKQYVASHNAAQRERGYATDAEGNVQLAGVNAVQVPYQAPMEFDAWRAKKKGTKTAATTPSAQRRQQIDASRAGAPKPAASATPPAKPTQPQKANATKDADGTVRVQLPDGRVAKFPSQEKADEFARRAGLTYSSN